MNKRKPEASGCVVAAVIDESRDRRMSHPSVHATAQERACTHVHPHTHTHVKLYSNSAAGISDKD